MGFWQFATGGGSGGGTGDVVGPASSTDNAVARFDLATGKLLQNSAVTIADTNGNLESTAAAQWTLSSADFFPIAINGRGGNGVLLQRSGITYVRADSDGMQAASGTQYAWSSGAVGLGSDTGLARRAAGVVKVTDGGAGYGSLAVGSGTKTAPALALNGDTDTGFYYRTTDAVTMTGGGKEMAYFGQGGAAVSYLLGFGASSGDFSSAAADFSIARTAASKGRVSNGYADSAIGSLLMAVEVEANTAGSGTPNALDSLESSKVLTNEGATAKNYHTLPSAGAGYQFTFVVQDADGMRIVANTDDTIRVIDKVTAAAGYIESTTIGSTVTLVSINAVEWYAVAITGVWTDGTFTYDDTSLTTP